MDGTKVHPFRYALESDFPVGEVHLKTEVENGRGYEIEMKSAIMRLLNGNNLTRPGDKVEITAGEISGTGCEFETIAIVTRAANTNHGQTQEEALTRRIQQPKAPEAKGTQTAYMFTLGRLCGNDYFIAFIERVRIEKRFTGEGFRGGWGKVVMGERFGRDIKSEYIVDVIPQAHAQAKTRSAGF